MRLQNFAKAPILAARQKKRSIVRSHDGICRRENAAGLCLTDMTNRLGRM